jgi:hypothetical protein
MESHIKLADTISNMRGINGSRGVSIFVPEWLAPAAFALSWLVKGRAHKTIAAIASSQQ